MKQFEFKNIGNIIKNEFKIRYKSLILWVLGLSVVMIIYMVIYPSVKDMMVEEFNALPPELLAFFGANDLDVRNFNYYFAMMYKIASLVICAYALVASANILHDEEQSGSIEYLFAQRVSRMEIIVAKFLYLVITFVIINVVIIFCALICGAIIQEPSFDFWISFKAGMVSSLITYLFVAAGLLISAHLKKSVKPVGLALGLFFSLYLLGYISSLGVDSLAFFKWFSPIEYCTAVDIVSHANRVFEIIFILGLTIVFIVSAVFIYRKKDF